MRTERRAPGRRPALPAAACAAALLLSGCASDPAGTGATGGTTAGTPAATATGTAGGTVPAGTGADGEPDPAAVATDPRTPAPAGPGPASPVVLVTWSGWDAATSSLQVGGYADVVEPDGTCTLTVTDGATEVTVSQAATPDVVSTSCGDMTVPGDRLSSGTWEAVLGYESPASRGVSEPVRVVVP